MRLMFCAISICLFSFCGNESPSASNVTSANDSNQEGVKGSWYAALIKTTGNPDHVFDQNNFTSMIHIGDSIWTEYSKMESKTGRIEFLYDMTSDSTTVLLTKDGSTSVNYNVHFLGDSLHLHVNLVPGTEQDIFYARWDGSVPPSTWPSLIEDLR